LDIDDEVAAKLIKVPAEVAGAALRHDSCVRFRITSCDSVARMRSSKAAFGARDRPAGNRHLDHIVGQFVAYYNEGKAAHHCRDVQILRILYRFGIHSLPFRASRFWPFARPTVT